MSVFLEIMAKVGLEILEIQDFFVVVAFLLILYFTVFGLDGIHIFHY